jgi:hypothetical protein
MSERLRAYHHYGVVCTGPCCFPEKYQWASGGEWQGAAVYVGEDLGVCIAGQMRPQQQGNEASAPEGDGQATSEVSS